MSLKMFRRFNSKLNSKNSEIELELPEYSAEEREGVLRSAQHLIDYRSGFLYYYYPNEEVVLQFNSKKVVINNLKLSHSDPISDVIFDVMTRIDESRISKDFMPKPTACIKNYATRGTNVSPNTSLKSLYILQQALNNYLDTYLDIETYDYNCAVMAQFGVFKNVDIKAHLTFEQLLVNAGIRSYPTVLIDAYLYLGQHHLRGWNSDEHEYSSDLLSSDASSHSSLQLDTVIKQQRRSSSSSLVKSIFFSRLQ